MTTERHDDGLAEVLRAARPAPRPGWRERALDTMERVRPRRRRVWLLVLVVLGLSGLGAASVLPLFIEGTLYFWSAEEVAPNESLYVSPSSLSGDMEPGQGSIYADGDYSSVDERVTWAASQRWDWPPTRMDIFVGEFGDPQGVNLTAQAGIGGVNCHPRWSPDSSMIAFVHCDPESGVYPCDSGFHLWVMNSDGTEAHRVTPEDFPPTGRARWSPDGQWLLSGIWVNRPQEGTSFITDIWGTDIREIPNVGTDGMWSPDGSMIVSCDEVEGELEGAAGTWRRLVLTNADGSEPEVLVEQFIVHAEVDARYPDEEMLSSHPDFDWHNDVLAWVGPREPVWSPDGSKIAFLAALPFEPDGLYYKNQLEIWVYDLRDDELTQITDDEVAQHWIRWKP